VKNSLTVRRTGVVKKYISIGNDYRSYRDSIFFKKIYDLRTESERYNSRWKSLNIEQASVRNINSVITLNTTGHIFLSTIVIAAIKSGCAGKYKSLSGLRMTAETKSYKTF
jgi:hypothetical protein